MNKKDSSRSARLHRCVSNSVRSLLVSLPMLTGIILLMGLLRATVPKEMLFRFFGGGVFCDTLVGAVAGSVSGGNAITSYIAGGEILAQGGSLFAVTAFLVAWVTVGILQLPVEASFLGRRFAVARNLIGFILIFPVAIATVLLLKVLG